FSRLEIVRQIRARGGRSERQIVHAADSELAAGNHRKVHVTCGAPLLNSHRVGRAVDDPPISIRWSPESFAVGLASFSSGGDTEANGDYSFASGKLANARRITEYAHAGGSFTGGEAFSKVGLGESQYSRLVLLGSVDDSAQDQNQDQTVYMHLGGTSGATS